MQPSCATLTRDAQLGCMSQALEKPHALYAPFPFPAKNAVFTVNVEGTDHPAKYLSHTTWGESARQPGVGTAWLILIDADKRMGKGLDDARQVASQFIAAMGPSDIVNVMFFNDRQVVSDSKWLPAAKKAAAKSFVDSVTSTYPSQGRNRSLLSILKTAATDGFKGLGNVGAGVDVPMHQAMVVLSSGFGGADPSTTGPGAMQLSSYMTGGRFPEDNTALPKAPVPVISVYFPHRTFDEFKQNSLDFMQNLANPQIGGFFTVMQDGEGERAGSIVKAVRTRFSEMYVVKWRVACIAPSITQSFKMVFRDVQPPIMGDNSFKDVPIGIDPTTWPLDVDVKYSQEMASREGGLFPGGTFKVFGEFCWGGDVSRAEVYFVPAGQPLPKELQGADVEKAKRTQQQLIAMGMRGKALEATDTFVSFEAPDKEKILHGSGAQALARILVYDNKARRMSGITADSILQLKARTAPLPILWILGGAFGLVVLALLGVIVLRGGNKRRPAPAPTAGAAAVPVPTGYPGGSAAAQPAAAAAPRPAVDPLAMTGTAAQATLQGSAGVYTVGLGQEVRVGRDGSQCAVLLTDPRVSGVHASLKLEGGQLYVRDEGSNNGTTVGTTPAPAGSWTVVPGGTLLRFGPIEFSVQLK